MRLRFAPASFTRAAIPLKWFMNVRSTRTPAAATNATPETCGVSANYGTIGLFEFLIIDNAKFRIESEMTIKTTDRQDAFGRIGRMHPDKPE